MAQDFQPITSSDQIEKLPLTQSVLLINGIFGTLAILPNLLLFVILISPGKRYGRDNVLLIASCLSDIISCVALSMTGFTRYSLVSLALKEHAIPVVTQWSCVAYAFVSIRLIGNVMAPLTQIANAIERYICIRHPLRYRQQFITRQIIAVSIVLSATTVAIVTATAVAYVNGNKPTNFLCGRREAYGSTFAIFLYGLLVGGYLTAFLIGLFSYIFVVKNRGGFKRQHVQKLEIVTVMSFISFVLISVPNFTLIISLIRPHPDVITHIVLLTSSLCHSLSIFVYMALSSDFRKQLFKLLCGCSLKLHSSSGVRIPVQRTTTKSRGMMKEQMKVITLTQWRKERT